MQRLKVLSVLLPQTRHLIFSRFKHENSVRVRFAPSPTGLLHLGGLRTALYNFLFAKSQKGKFILRIEDTDQTRLVPGATETLIEDLLWSGILIDEGPGFGGDRGPYIQSKRVDIYNEYVQKLLKNGTAYRCFCTERRLDLLRKEALRTRQIPRYDNKCRYLTEDQIKDLLNKNTAYCIRFVLKEYTEPLNDLIYGNVSHNVSETEGDPIIMKTDGFPTYHFANVVDDHLMGITHVLRGIEWQISTTKHLLLYKAFGWLPPLFGHLPLLVNPDGTKLSKRQGDIGIKYFRENGLYPNAVVNYVVSAGGGFEHLQAEKPKVHSLDELSEKFSLNRVNSHPSRLSPDILDTFNRLEIKRLLEDKTSLPRIIVEVTNFIKHKYPKEQNLDLEPQHIECVLKWSTNRVSFIKDLVSPQLSFLWVKPSQFSLANFSEDKMSLLISQLQTEDFSKDNLNKFLKHFAQANEMKFANLMKTLRSAISGLKEGPGVAEMMEILGKECVLQRLNEYCDTSADTNKCK